MSNFVIPQNAMIISVEKSAVNEATEQDIKVGDVLDSGTVLVLYPDTHFTLIYLDGTRETIKPETALNLGDRLENDVEVDTQLDTLSLTAEDYEILDKAIEEETAADNSILANNVGSFIELLRNGSDLSSNYSTKSVENEFELVSQDPNQFNTLSFSFVQKSYEPKLTVNNMDLMVTNGEIVISGEVEDFPPGSTVRINFVDGFFGGDVFNNIPINADGTFSRAFEKSDLIKVLQGGINLTVSVIDNGVPLNAIGKNTYLDFEAPNKPVVSLTQDSNGDVILNAEELADQTYVRFLVDLKDSGAKSGDFVEINGQQYEITPTNIRDNELSVQIPKGELQGVVDTNITLVDAKGNRSELADLKNILIDTVAPGKGEIDLGKAEDGLNLKEATDGLTLSVRLPADAKVGDSVNLSIKLPNNEILPFTATISQQELNLGSVEFQILSNTLLQHEGTIEAVATLIDIAGNQSEASEPMSFNADYSIGDAPSIAVSEAIINGSSASESLADVKVRVTLGDGVKIGDLIKITVDHDGKKESLIYPIITSVTSGQVIEVSLSPTYFPNEGRYQVSATLNDKVGNESASSNILTFSVDKQPPEVPQISISELDNFGVNKKEIKDGVTTKITLANDTQTGDKLTLTLTGPNGVEVGTVNYTVKETDSAGDVIELDLLKSLFETQGQYLLTATIEDKAGNISAPDDDIVINVDTLGPGREQGVGGNDISPLITLIETDVSTGDRYINRADFDSVVNGQSIPFRVELPLGANFGDYLRVNLIPTNGGNEIIVEFNIGQSDIVNGFTTVDLGISALTTATADGEYDISASVIDRVGNSSVPSPTINFTFDINAPISPEFSIVDDASGSDISLTSGDYSNDALPLIKGENAEKGASIEIFDQDNNSIVVVPANDDGTWVYQLTTELPEGEHSFTAVQTDAAGNVGPKSDTFTIFIDLMAPGTTGGEEGAVDSKGNFIRFDQTDEFINDSEAPSISLVGFIEANAALNSIVISDGVNPDIVVPASKITVVDGAISVTDLDLSNLEDGTLTVTMSVTDQARNEGAVSDTIVKHPTLHTIGEVSDSDDSANVVASDSKSGAYTGVTAHAEDLDGDYISFHLIDDLGGLLAIDSETGRVTLNDVSNLGIQGTEYLAQVLAKSSDGSSSSESFLITVGSKGIGDLIDIDDTTFPEENGVQIPNFISENAPKDTAVGITAQAVDEDSPGAVTYSLTESDLANGLFSIGETSGIVTLVGELDFETQQTHEITVIATSPDGTTSSNTFTINVGNNEFGAGGEGTTGDTDHAISAIVDSDQVVGSLVSENAEAGTYVGITAFATDEDGDEVTYALSQADIDAGLFAIDKASGRVTLTGNLDYEAAQSHDITIIANSADGSSSTQSFTIRVGDNNAGLGGGEETGDKDRPIGEITDTNTDSDGPVSENAEAGTLVGITAFAQDPDGDDVTYRLANGGDNELFTINATSGVVTLAGNLDYETAQEHTITVIATSTDGSTSQKDFVIAVGDNDNGNGSGGDTDNAVEMLRDNDARDNLVSENAPINTQVGITALAEDKDGDDITYHLSDKDIADGVFAIDSNTGVVTVISDLDYEKQNEYTISITAKSTDGSTATEEFVINVGNNNEGIGGGSEPGDKDNLISDITDIDPEARPISENAPVGTAVGIQAKATDADGDAISYALSASDLLAGLFAIDSDTGVIRLASDLDFEAAASHDVTVIASSTDGSTSTKTFTIAVGDNNDGIDGGSEPGDKDNAVGDITDIDTTLEGKVSENLAIGGKVGITAFAKDDDGDAVTYSLSDKYADAAMFDIDATEGIITLKGNLDYETKTSHTIEVIATSTDGSTSQKDFVIDVGDNNDGIGGGSETGDKDHALGQLLDKDATDNRVSENAPVGSPVGLLAFAEDEDGDAVTYRLSDSDIAAGLFEIDATSGLVTVKGNLDFETATSHDITIVASSTDGSSSSRVFTINVDDEAFDKDREVGPVSDSDNTLDSVSENAEVGDLVGVTALAKDDDVSDSVTYSLADGGDNALFSIEANTGIVRVAGNLDFETAQQHTITVIATSTDGSTATESFEISVENNVGGAGGGDTDNAVGEISDVDSRDSKISENAPAGTEIGIKAQATDADEGDVVTYSLSAADIANGVFEIDATSGVITLNGNLDFETAPSHEITVIATSNDGSSSAKTFEITVGDNEDGRGGEGSTGDTDNAVGPVTDVNLADNGPVSENAPKGTPVGITANATDEDGDAITYSLSDSDITAGLFAIDATSGVITVDGNLDYETTDRHVVTVIAHSADGSSSSENFVINVADNHNGYGGEGTGGDTDNAVEMLRDNDARDNVVSENAPMNTQVGITALAEDKDGDDITYHLSDKDIADGVFAIDSNTGVVTVISDLDYEARNHYSISITAKSSDGSTATEEFVINVGNNNEGIGGGSEPGDKDNLISDITDIDPEARPISENAPIGTAVGIQANATDDDGDAISYALSASDLLAGLFAIDSDTGVIRLASDLDFETAQSHEVTVIASSTDGSTSIKTFTIAVGDNNDGLGGGSEPGDKDNTVGDITDIDTTLEGKVSENLNAGEKVGITAFAEDEDGDAVTYSLSDKYADAAMFDINATSGVITLKGNLDYETKTSHTIEVIATSTDGSTSQKEFVIDVGDNNDGIGGGSETGDKDHALGQLLDKDVTDNSVSENAPVGSPVGLLAFADDEDGDAVTYRLSDDDIAAGLFEVDATSGLVTVKGNLDYETAKSHDITIIASSTDGSSSSKVFTIAVEDEAFDLDRQVGPVSDSDNTLNSVSENAEVGDLVGVTAFAKDEDVSDSVSYSLADGGDNALFSIDASTGIVRVAGNLDFETAQAHTITVIATSTDGSTATESFEISVENNVGGAGGGDTDNAVGEISDVDSRDSKISENAPAGTEIGIKAQATDADEGDVVAYSLSAADVDNGVFEIDATSGVITLKGNLDYETGPSHEITVIATSNDGSSSAKTFEITVGNNEDGRGGEGSTGDTDNAVGAITDIDPINDKVSENADVGTEIGIKAFAEDSDGDAVTYSLALASQTLFAIDETSGVITLIGNLDYETAQSHAIEVIATSADGSTSQETFVINVGDNNDGIGGSGGDKDNAVGPVTDIDTNNAAVSENAEKGDSVGIKAKAIDADAGDVVTYSLKDDDNGRFAIDSSTGVVTLAGNLDYEDAEQHTIVVLARSNDGSTSSESFVINVKDESPDTDRPVGEITDTNVEANEIGEHAIPGTDVGIKAFAEDPDGDAVTYRLSDADISAGLFTIDSSSGVVTLVGDLNYEAQPSHTISAIAESADGSTSTKDFTINVLNEAEGIEFTKSVGGLAIEQTAVSGDIVGEIVAKSFDGNEVAYEITAGNEQGYVEIDATSGIITLTDAGIFALNDNVGNVTSLSITVKVSSGEGSEGVSDTTSVTITLDETIVPTIELDSASDSGDANDDNITNVDMPVITGQGEVGATVVLTIGTQEIGRGEVKANGTYSIVSTVSLANGTHEVVATATDNVGNVERNSINLTIDTSGEGGITVDPVTADNLIERSEYSDTIILTGKVSGELAAGDSVTTQINGQNYSGSVNADGITWSIEGVKASDIVFDNDFVVAAQGIDIAGNAIYAQTDVSVDVFANEAPIALDDKYRALETSEVLVDERFVQGETTGWQGQISAHDRLIVENGTSDSKTFDFGAHNAGKTVLISFIARGTRAWDGKTDNFIVRANGEVIVNRSLKDNTWREYNNLEATIDANGQVKVSIRTSTDHSKEDLFFDNLVIKSTPGYLVPLELDENESYTIDSLSNDSDPDRDAISIVALNDTPIAEGESLLIEDSEGNALGTVTLNDGKFDFEPSPRLDGLAVGERQAVSFNYTISDGFGKSDTATVSFTIIGSNDKPIIEQTVTSLEEDSQQIVIGRVSDTDGTIDLALSSVSSLNGTLTIENGNIIYTPESNFHGVDEITVVAVDNNGARTDAKFTVTVVSVNDVVTKPIDEDQTTFEDKDGNQVHNLVSENADVGTDVGIKAFATDVDEGDSVSYSLTDDADGTFVIDSSSGIVTLAKKVDYETQNEYSITVLATSSDGTTNSDSFIIRVGDNEHGNGGEGSTGDKTHSVSDITDNNATDNFVNENAPLNTSVGITALATDKDDGDTVTYKLSAADEAAGLFEIHETTGVVTVKGALDHETADTHTIEIIATSSDGSTSSDTFTINVTDVNEAISPLTDINDDANSVAENADAGTPVGITALAKDEDEGDTVTYKLSAADEAAGLFEIHETTGVVTLKGALDHETADTHTIEIIATSSDGSTSSDSFTINVTDVNEAISPLTDINDDANSVAENADAGTPVGITALAKDEDEGDTVTYKLSAADEAAGLFEIHETTGVVTVKGALDHETADTHTIEIIATSSDGSTSSDSFTINVTDVNEAISPLTDINDDANS
ncbi:MAG: cadherin domain-containing protein, partial [Psychrobium sp.]